MSARLPGRSQLLATTALVAMLAVAASPAFSQGAPPLRGGSGGGGGAGSVSGLGFGSGGGSETGLGGGGGGGAGDLGGDGGTGGATPGGGGGAASGAAGSPGGSAAGPGTGGGGGGGGAHGYVGATLPGGVVAGGAGGAGGAAAFGGGGGGGAGGFGAVVTGNGALGTLSNPVFGGQGGAGGLSGNFFAGGGGAGGNALVLTGTNVILTIDGNVIGGSGGIGGNGATFPGASGLGGNALLVQGTGATITINPGVFVSGGVTPASGINGFGMIGGAFDLRLNGRLEGGTALFHTNGNSLLALGAAGRVDGIITIDAGSLAITPHTGGSVLDGQINGNGALVVGGSGALILTGANTYSGGTIINAGATLQLGNGGTTGTISPSGGVENNGTLAVNRSGSLTLNNPISGAGSVVMNGPGTLLLLGNNSFAGGFVVNAGTVAFTDQTTASTGSITLNGGAIRPSGFAFASLSLANAIIIGANGGTITGALQAGGEPSDPPRNITLTGGVTGAGGLTIGGPGTVFLESAATHAGGTTINTGGTLQVGTGGTAGLLTGDVLNNGQLTFNRGDAVTFGGVLSGAGALTQAGAGTLILTGNNIHSGLTTINAGRTLQVGNGGAGGALGTGQVVNNGTLVFNRAGTLNVPGVISGPGGLVQNGPGNVILGGANTYTGPTTVNAGILSVNGSLSPSSLLTVNPGGTLGGTGSVGTVVVAAGSVLAPGNSIGTLNLSGNLTLAPGSTTVIEVQGATSDRANVAGTATLGGTLRLVPLGGNYVFNTPYTLIQAGAIAGNFAAVTTDGSFGAGVTSAVTTTGTQVLLALTPATLSRLPLFNTFNQRATAGALDAAGRAGGNLSPFFNVYNQPAASIGTAVNQLSGEVATAGPAMAFSAGDQFLAAMLDPLGYGRESIMGGRLRAGAPAGASGVPYALWGSAYGGFSRTGGNGADGSAARSTRVAGFVMGFDRLLGMNSVVGGAIAAGDGQSSLAGSLGTARGSYGQFGVHGATRLAGFTFAGALSGTYMEVDTRRTLYTLGQDRQSGEGTSWTFSGRVEARQDGAAFGGVRLQPFAGLQWHQVSADGYTERSGLTGTTLGQRVSGGSHGMVRLELGGQADGAFTLGGRAMRAFGRVAWTNYLARDFTMGVGFAGLPGAGFAVRGARADLNAALISTGAEAALTPRLTLGMRLDSELSGNMQQVSGTARLRYAF